MAAADIGFAAARRIPHARRHDKCTAWTWHQLDVAVAAEAVQHSEGVGVQGDGGSDRGPDRSSVGSRWMAVNVTGGWRPEGIAQLSGSDVAAAAGHNPPGRPSAPAAGTIIQRQRQQQLRLARRLLVANADGRIQSFRGIDRHDGPIAPVV